MSRKERLDKARGQLTHRRDALAKAVAAKDFAEAKIAEKKLAKERHEDDDKRLKELEAQLDQAREDFVKARAEARRLERSVTRAARRVKRLARQVRNTIRPKIVDLGFDRTAQSTLTRQGAIHNTVGHYTAGPVDDDGDDEAFALWRAYDRAHKGLGWACLGYPWGVTRDGTIARLRGREWVGAHTGGYNTNHDGCSVHGTLGDTWSKPQRRAFRYALKKFGTIDKAVIGHKEAPGQATSCPGDFLAGYKSKGKSA